MAGKQLKTMDVSALLALRGKIDAILAGKRKEFEKALAALGAAVASKPSVSDPIAATTAPAMAK